MSAAGTVFVGTTLKTYTKFLVTGAHIVVASGGSVGTGTPKTIGVGRLGASGTHSVYQKFSITISAAGSCLGDTFDFSLSNPMTVASFGEAAVISGSSATIADHGCVLQQVIWRYRILPLVAS